jgi:hypothetical protein
VNSFTAPQTRSADDPPGYLPGTRSDNKPYISMPGSVPYNDPCQRDPLAPALAYKAIEAGKALL